MELQKILVVEDNPVNMELVVAVLEGEGHTVIQALNAEQGISAARAHSPSLILMDIGLPGMDGLRATEILKGDPQTRDTVIVALTAYAMNGDEQKALAAGCQGYISKPIEIGGFLIEVARYIESGTKLDQAA